MNPAYPAVADRAGHRCEYCHAPEATFNFRLEVEHILPTTRGGRQGLENLALSCRACNLFKSDAVTAIDSLSGKSVRLFDPRVDRWQEHFGPTIHGEIIGLTETGRASVERLRFNTPGQIAARLLWMTFGLFP